MKVTSVGISKTQQQEIALTPELLAAVGARYSRNNEGLASILKHVEGMDQDKAVDSIFNMVDYGHRSITDMAPVAMFMDDISIFMALKLWHLASTGSGQESSTRYIKLSKDKITKPHNMPGFKEDLIINSFDAYQRSLDLWSQLATENPEIIQIPENKKDDQKFKDRIKRNFAFDRARCLLPMCGQTNAMIIMNARGWIDIIKYLASDIYQESVDLADQLRVELGKATPRLLKHTKFCSEHNLGIIREHENILRRSDLDIINPTTLKRSTPFLYVNTPSEFLLKYEIEPDSAKNDLKNHSNRYSFVGSTLKRTTVRFGWQNLTIAELRDLNRHRTGYKYFDLMPRGYYCADDEMDKYEAINPKIIEQLRKERIHGENLVKESHEIAKQKNQYHVYYMPLGTQCYYEHVTTANHFLYQCELRTGAGSHYTYAERMREVLELWHQQFPDTRKIIKPGLAEPE